MYKTILPILLVLAADWLGCAGGNRKYGKPITDVDYLPLAEVQFEKANLENGRELKIIGTVRGRPNEGDTVFFHQFITIDLETGDTLVILSPLISVSQDSDPTAKTHSSALLFDIDEGVTRAYFQPLDTGMSLLLMNVLPDVSSEMAIHLLDRKNEIRYAVLEKSTDKVHRIAYKATVGELNFKKVPWGTGN